MSGADIVVDVGGMTGCSGHRSSLMVVGATVRGPKGGEGISRAHFCSTYSHP